MKICITGASGLVGNALVCAALERAHEVVAFYHHRKPNFAQSVICHQLDLGEPERALPVLLETFPDAIINAAAISSPAEVDKSPKLSEQLNVALPQRLAEVAHHLGARIIQISTDLVFDGQQGPYSADDAPNPVGTYGRQKLSSEQVTLEHGGELATVVRIPIVTGNSPSAARSVHEKLLTQLARGETLHFADKEIRQPVAAANAAEAMIEICERSKLRGIYHWAGTDRISRYSMAEHILIHLGLPTDLIGLSDDTAGARNLSMDISPLAGVLKTRPQSFAAQLEHMLIPPDCWDWYSKNTNPSENHPTPCPRLIKGRDYF